MSELVDPLDFIVWLWTEHAVVIARPRICLTSRRQIAGRRKAACVERRAACGASYNACASGATPCKFETRQPARPAGKARADRQFQRRVGRRGLRATDPQASNPYSSLPHEHSRTNFGPIV